jgi:hypothetical protein
MRYNTFRPNKHYSMCAFDTETKIITPSGVISTDKLIKLIEDNGVKYIKEKCRVDVYAWTLSAGNVNCICDNFNEFLATIVKHKIKTLWVYNAVYDFSNIDYQILASGWKIAGEEKAPNTYTSLHSDFGQRYCLELNIENGDNIHTVKIYDLKNICGGGLDKLLKDFDIRDANGTPIKKLETQDYQNETTIEYMLNDVVGLYYLLQKIDTLLFDNFGIQLIRRAKPSCLTIGAIGKRVLLDEMYPDTPQQFRLDCFQEQHPINKEQDRYIRDLGLYRGGLTLLNPKQTNKKIDRPIYKYDKNSMYPSKMQTMYDLINLPKKVKYDDLTIKDFREFEVILIFDFLNGKVKPGFVPVLIDDNDEYKDTIEYTEKVAFFMIEFIELKKWYDFDYHITDCLLVRKGENHYKKFVDKLYTIKDENKGINNSLSLIAKFVLNASYGKIGEKFERPNTHRELNENGIVHLVQDDTKTENDKFMNVIVASYITALARIDLLKTIREMGDVANNFIYCDTDSIHSFKELPGHLIDNRKLGAWGYEGCFNHSKYLAPKTYINLTNEVFNAKIDIIRAKGIPRKSLTAYISDKNFKDCYKIFAPGKKVLALSSFNLIGGKGLLTVWKEICKETNTIIYNDEIQDEVIKNEKF